MDVAVTGAAGFVGSRLTGVLSDMGMSLLTVDRRPIAAPPGGRAIIGDIRNENVARAVARARTVVHLAALTGVRDSWTVPQKYWDCNLRGTAVLMNAISRQRNPPRVVFYSTSSVYAAQRLPATEIGTTRPASPYGRSKLAAEAIVRSAADRHSLQATIIRPFTLYGESQRPGMAIAQLIDCAVTGTAFRSDGPLARIRRDWTYVGDVIDVTTRLLVDGVTWPRVVNVGTGRETSLATVVAMLEDLGLARPTVALRAPGADRHVRADTTLLRASFPCHPFTPLRDGLRLQVGARLGCRVASPGRAARR
jgi:nucleoside-diphosphate-sugar epimerase